MGHGLTWPREDCAARSWCWGEPVEDGRSGKVEWPSSFEAAGASEPEAVQVVRGIHEAGFENRRRIFGT
jgi:hypothetical protein